MQELSWFFFAAIATPLGWGFVVEEELVAAALTALPFAHDAGWKKVVVKTDSSFEVRVTISYYSLAFSSSLGSFVAC